MKTWLPKTLLMALVIFSVPAVYGLSSDFDIHVSAKMADSSTTQGGDRGTNRAKEDWVYDVTIENKAFHDLTGLEVKYTIFFKQEKQGSKSEPVQRHKNGSFQIPTMRTREKQTFTTDSVELKKSNLVGAYHYTNGGRLKAEDTLVGMAIRIYQNGQEVAEYGNPSSLLQEKAD